MDQEIIKEAIAILEKEEYLDSLGVYERTPGVEEALAKLRSIKAPEQPPASQFTKRFRAFIELSQEHLSKNKIGRLRTYGKEACDIIDRAEAEKLKAEMLAAFYLEGLEKSEAEIKELKVAIGGERMRRKRIISELIKHKRFRFPGGQPFACGASMRIFRNIGQECAGTLSPDKCMESTKDLKSCLDWYQKNNWKKG